MSSKPVILAVDDDPEVVRAVARNLRQAYGQDHRVVRAESGEAALEALRTLRAQGQPVALLLVDQRMPGMDGVGFLERARELYPEAKRALLTAYADTDAAIRAINAVQLDYYLMKPWHPPAENLYPVLDDLLADWRAGHRPPFEGVRLLDHRWSALGHQLRDFLARNHVPYRWLDAERDEEARVLLGCVGAGGAADADLPTVILPGGERLTRPAPSAIAERLGFTTHARAPFYDLLIVGAGPAGLAAAVYGSSEGLRVALIEREAPGGQAGTSSRIENYLGFPSGLSGADLSRRALSQAQRFGAEVILTQEVVGLRLDGPYKFVRLADGGGEISCHALVLAGGVTWRKLDAPGIEALTGAGVYYGAAVTEALGCQGQDVFVIGAGNSAGQGAVYLSSYARSVTILCRGEGLAASMSRYLIDRIEQTPNIRVRPRSVVTAARGGSGHLEAITVRDVGSGEETEEAAGALFIYIGAEPRTEWLDGLIERDRRGFVLTGPDLMQGGGRPAGWPLERDPYLTETNVPGVFAAGDVRHESIKRVASAVGEGSITVQFVHQYLAQL